MLADLSVTRATHEDGVGTDPADASAVVHGGSSGSLRGNDYGAVDHAHVDIAAAVDVAVRQDSRRS